MFDYSAPGAARHAAIAFGWRTILLTAAWWVLAEGRLHTPALMLALAGTAAAFSVALIPPQTVRVSATGLARFVPYFIGQSILGGVDVARRALTPRMPLEPGLLEIRIALPAGAPRALLATAVTLLPGTLCARLDDEGLLLHVLDVGQPIRERVADLEERVAGVISSADQAPRDRAD